MHLRQLPDDPPAPIPRRRGEFGELFVWACYAIVVACLIIGTAR